MESSFRLAGGRPGDGISRAGAGRIRGRFFDEPLDSFHACEAFTPDDNRFQRRPANPLGKPPVNGRLIRPAREVPGGLPDWNNSFRANIDGHGKTSLCVECFVTTREILPEVERGWSTDIVRTFVRFRA